MIHHPARGGALAGIMLTVLILAALAAAALVATGFFIAQNVRVANSDGGRTTVETPFGTIRVRESDKLDPQHLGVPMYPGAVRQPDTNKLASLQFDFGERHKHFAFAAAEYRTADSPEKVYDFYHSQLPHWIFRQKAQGGIQLELTEGGYKRIIVIHREDDETRIGLASMGEPASN